MSVQPELNQPVTLETLSQQLPPSDFTYFRNLYEQYINPKQEQLTIGVNFFPSAFLDEETLDKVLHQRRYDDMKDDEALLETARGIDLTVISMDAGIGSSIDRRRYLAKEILPHIDRSPAMSAKPTDLYITTEIDGEEELMDIAQFKLNHALVDAKNYSSYTYTHVVNDESQKSIDGLYQNVRPHRLIGGVNYYDVISRHGKMRFPESWLKQNNLPTVKKDTGEITFDYTAPGSHGQVGVMALDLITNTEFDTPNNIWMVTNGDGPNNFATAQMVAHTKEKAAITMVTTTRLGCDIKGGILGLRVDEDGTMSADIMERASAKASGQDKLFQQIGLPDVTLPEELPQELRDQHKPNTQDFNTNIFLLDANILHDFFQIVKAELGEEYYTELLQPSLIANPEGDKIKMEGAIGSLMLGINRKVVKDPRLAEIWERISGSKDFLQLIHVGPEDRDKVFTPIKFAPDFRVLKGYEVDSRNWQLKNKKTGHFPHLVGALAEKGFYADVMNALEAFGDDFDFASVDELDIEGAVLFANAQMHGKIKIVSPFKGKEPQDVFDLNSASARAQMGFSDDEPLVFENEQITIEKDGTVTRQKIQ